jgi:putative transposase
VFGALRRAIGRASVDRFRVIHFSIQQDHGHFIVEGDEARRARGGMHGLAIRLALAVNRALGRRQGKVVGDRYHVRALTTPRQMRTSMVYVLLNFRKHLNAPAGIDPRSSGPYFPGWHRRARLDSVDVAAGADAAIGGATAAATAAPTTWMATMGWWRAGGLLKLEERPAASRRPRPTGRPPPGPT